MCYHRKVQCSSKLHHKMITSAQKFQRMEVYSASFPCNFKLSLEETYDRRSSSQRWCYEWDFILLSSSPALPAVLSRWIEAKKKSRVRDFLFFIRLLFPNLILPISCDSFLFAQTFLAVGQLFSSASPESPDASQWGLSKEEDEGVLLIFF